MFRQVATVLRRRALSSLSYFPAGSIVESNPIIISHRALPGAFHPIRSFSTSKRVVTSFEVQDYDDFRERVLKSDKVVLVDFYADWCGPCKMLGPRLESIVDARAGKILLAKVNVDNNQDIADEYKVKSIPHVVAIKKGAEVEQFTGNQENETIMALINRLLHE